MARLPEGTVTFLLTDLQGSTQAWEKQPKGMRSAMKRHDAILSATVADHAGELVEAGREGDSVLAVFRTAATAAACAVGIQNSFDAESWPAGLDLKVRVALHTGEAQLRDGHYFGAALNRCARLLATCNPGQILMTKATEELLADELPEGAELRDLGQHRFKDLTRSEHVFQLAPLGQTTEFPRIQSLPQLQTNLPRYLTNFIGRSGDLAALRSLAAGSRMITLTGAGGSGKTRLAVELGRASVDFWPDGIWWVELTSLTDPLEMPGAVVAALNLPGRGPALDVATAAIANRKAALILDNCEHLAGACADFCQAALERCPGLAIIATSREPLGVAGEARWTVSSMEPSEAVELFETRARLVAPDFEVLPTNLETVDRICARLDGIPLAIELAAARLDVMSYREILEQLSDRFGLLTGGNRTAQERHQTMVATIDWSYRLLTEDEALLFRRLSVFRGGFDLESVEEVCGPDIGGTALDLLTGLVRKSMVVADHPRGSATRYRLLESQLAYAEARLKENGELDATRRRHYRYFVDRLGDRLGYHRLEVRARLLTPAIKPPKPPTAEEAAWIAREWGNLWAAGAWALDNADDRGMLVATRMALTNVPDTKAMRRLLDDVLERSDEVGQIRSAAHGLASNLANLQGDYEAALHGAEVSLALAKEDGGIYLVANALLRLGNVHQTHGDTDAAIEVYDEAMVLLKDSGNRELIASINNNVALIAIDNGDYGHARDILMGCIAGARAHGDATELDYYLDSVAWAHLGLGDHRAATASWRETLSHSRSVLNNVSIVFNLYGLSSAASARGDHERALRLRAAATNLAGDWFSSGTWLPKLSEPLLARSKASLGPQKSQEAWNAGWSMSVEQATDYALSEGEPEGKADSGPLSRRQREVARLVAAGLTNREIGERLFIAERSAEGHVERIRNKLGVRSRIDVATWAVEHGLAPGTSDDIRPPPSSRRHAASGD